MSRSISLLLLFAVAAAILPAGWAAGAPADESRLIEFEIEDQFDRAHSHEEFQNRVLVVLGGDRKGSQYQGLWGTALRDSLRNRGRLAQVEFCEVADVRGVPFFLKGFVKGKFPKDEDSWVLMDWKGRFAKAYGFEADKGNIAVFDRGGHLIHHTAVEGVSSGELEDLLRRIGALLPE